MRKPDKITNNRLWSEREYYGIDEANIVEIATSCVNKNKEVKFWRNNDDVLCARVTTHHADSRR